MEWRQAGGGEERESERERGVSGENKRVGREGRGWGSIRGGVGEGWLKREGEVVETETSLRFRTAFLLFACSLVSASFATPQ